VIPREQARRDVEETLDHPLKEAGQAVASGFFDALKAAFEHIAPHPATGSPRYAHELNLPGLRAWPLTRYPYLVFYVERAGHIDVWRVLHGHRDIPAWMQAPDLP
jgi:toxin ParE1/3/4